jgi:hypothetical protein
MTFISISSSSLRVVLRCRSKCTEAYITVSVGFGEGQLGIKIRISRLTGCARADWIQLAQNTVR